jgi:uncharacterized membrane protein
MNSLSYALMWILVVEIFSIATFPAISLVFKGIADKGFAVSKILGILVASYIVWVLASLHLVQFSRVSTISITVVVIGIFAAVVFLHVKAKQLEEMKMSNWLTKITKKLAAKSQHISLEQIHRLNRVVLLEEILFLGSFFAWIYLRGITPTIMGTEKFMDFGIVNALLKSPYLPPHDMWLSGFSLNYYYYGQYIFAFLIKLSGVPSNYAYNFALPTLFALAITLTTSLVYTLTKRLSVGVLTGFILTCAGNLHYALSAIAYFAQHQSLSGFSYWYPTATRLIPYTINEYPIYSFIVSDLHAHVIDIPIVLVSIIISLNILLKRSFNLFDVLLSGFIVGIMGATNSWDAFIYLSVLGIVLIYLYVIDTNRSNQIEKDLGIKDRLNEAKDRIKRIEFNNIVDFLNLPIFQAISATAFVGILGLILFLPFYLTFKPPVDGVGLNTIAHSSFSIELVLFGFFFFFIASFVVYLFYAILTKKKFHATDIFVIYLVCLGILLLIGPELFFLKDIFYKANPPYFRANTVFKLYYEAWILFSISTGYIIARINGLLRLKDVDYYTKGLVIVWDIIVLTLLGAVFFYTYQGIDEAYLNVSTKNAATPPTNSCIGETCWAGFTTDNGTAYIKTQSAGDYAMITWLNLHAPASSIIAEAVGDSYTYAARISANTGLAAVLGWPNHEYQWRNTYTYSGTRTTDIFNLYNGGSLKVMENVIHKYHITYIIVGDFERTQYPSINETLLKQTGNIIFSFGTSYIIQTK